MSIKISELPNATSLGSAHFFPVTQGSSTRKVSFASMRTAILENTSTDEIVLPALSLLRRSTIEGAENEVWIRHAPLSDYVRTLNPVIVLMRKRRDSRNKLRKWGAVGPKTNNNAGHSSTAPNNTYLCTEYINLSTDNIFVYFAERTMNSNGSLIQRLNGEPYLLTNLAGTILDVPKLIKSFIRVDELGKVLYFFGNTTQKIQFPLTVNYVGIQRYGFCFRVNNPNFHSSTPVLYQNGIPRYLYGTVTECGFYIKINKDASLQNIVNNEGIGQGMITPPVLGTETHIPSIEFSLVR